MLKIRLQRVGKKHEPVFRVVVTDSHAGPKAGNAVEVVGAYDPRFNKVDLKKERISHWMKEGAQVSDTVHNLLVSEKVVDGKKVNVLPKKSAPVIEEAPAEEAPAPAAEAAPVEETPTEVEAPAEETATPEEAPAPLEETTTEAPVPAVDPSEDEVKTEEKKEA